MIKNISIDEKDKSTINDKDEPSTKKEDNNNNN